MKRIYFEGLNFLVGNKNQVTNFIFNLICQQKSFILLPASLNDLAEANKSANNKKSYKKVTYCVTDGMPLVWLFNYRSFGFFKQKQYERVYGPTLMKEIFGFNAKEINHFLYGSSSEVLTKLNRNIIDSTPNTQIVGQISPPFRQLTLSEEARFIFEIRKSKATVLWLGLSSPKQVLLAARWSKFLPNVGIMCVGAAFDFLAKKQVMAPPVLQKNGLEWLFRLIVSPKRLWKRYLVTIPSYLIKRILFFR